MLSLSRREAVAGWPQTPAVQMVGLWLVTTQCNNIQLITESQRPQYCGLDMLSEESHLQGNAKCVVVGASPDDAENNDVGVSIDCWC